MKKAVWLKPEIVAQIEFLEWTDADRLRHSKFVGLSRGQESTRGRERAREPILKRRMRSSVRVRRNRICFCTRRASQRRRGGKTMKGRIFAGLFLCSLFF